LIEFWQHLPSLISPVIFSIGGFSLRWYGVSYLFAALTVYFLARYRLQTEKFSIKPVQLLDFLGYVFVGVLVFGRLGYIVFYDFPSFLADPLFTLLPVDADLSFTGFSGMSYHGGLIGAVLTGLMYCKRGPVSPGEMADLIVPAFPLGYMFGRLGNFMNGELYGRVAHVPWGMYFPHDPAGLLRHPSQLYEAFGEGTLLFLILWLIRGKVRPYEGIMLPLYLIGYGVIRFFIEFYRQPDLHLGTVLGPFTMGQVLCLAMIFAGTLWSVLILKNRHSER